MFEFFCKRYFDEPLWRFLCGQVVLHLSVMRNSPSLTLWQEILFLSLSCFFSCCFLLTTDLKLNFLKFLKQGNICTCSATRETEPVIEQSRMIKHACKKIQSVLIPKSRIIVYVNGMLGWHGYLLIVFLSVNKVILCVL